jgi:hypothetical protein
MPPTTFEPLKLITLGLSVLLLAPLGIVFWRMAVHRPWPPVEQREFLEPTLRERSDLIGTTNEDGSTVTATAVRAGHSIGFSDRTDSWLSFYPRRWVGIMGLLAVAAILLCLVVSLFMPQGELLISPPQ